MTAQSAERAPPPGKHLDPQVQELLMLRKFGAPEGFELRSPARGSECDAVEACRRIFTSDTRWTVVRGSNLEEGQSQGLPVSSQHVGDPILKSNIMRRVDFALFMVTAVENDALVHQAPAIVGCQTPSALVHVDIGGTRPLVG